MKRIIFLVVGLFINSVILSHGMNGSNTLLNDKYSVASVTIEVRIIKIVFVTKDTILNGFMVFDTLGIFHAFASRERLDMYKQSVSGLFYYFDDKILGTGNYIRKFNIHNETDTIFNFINSKIDYYEGENLKVDNIGIPILEYDIEHSYILRQMNQNISNQYIYCLINKGTMRFYGIHPPNYLKSSILLKVDMTQDTTYNFFMYRAETKSYQGMQLIAEDSTTVPLKKLKKRKQLFVNMDELLTLESKSNIHSSNYERNYVLVVKGERFIVSNKLNQNEHVDSWVSLVESISITLEQLQKKFLKNY